VFLLVHHLLSKLTNLAYAESMERRRRRQTLAPLPATSSSVSPVGLGSRFGVLGDDLSGSDAEEINGIPFQVASQVLEEDAEVFGGGWTPVTRKKRSKAETVADFWHEISYPTSASRLWEGSRRSVSSSGEQAHFCRSAGAVERPGATAASTPAVSLKRGSASSPMGVCLARGSQMGPWRGPLPRRRISPPPILG
jgi:hypothetical protein